MPIVLPIAGTSISLVLLVGIGLAIGCLSGLLGVGGGFLLTPLLMLIGVTPSIAAASGTNTVVATSASGAVAHYRLGNLDIKMGCVLLLGGLTGGAIGVRLLELLKELGEASVAISATYILVLAGVGTSILINSLTRPALATGSYGPAGTRLLRKRLPLQLKFPRSGVEHSVFLPIGVAVMVGLLTSMGMGGGFALVPLMVYLLDMPAHMAVGTSLFQIFFTSCGVTYMQATGNHTVDLVLVFPLAVGSAVGAQIGARLSRYVPGHRLMILLGILVLIVMLEMVFRLVRAPSNMVSPAMLLFCPR
jgi:uncharacterized membrane protein YfcA